MDYTSNYVQIVVQCTIIADNALLSQQYAFNLVNHMNSVFQLRQRPVYSRIQTLQPPESRCKLQPVPPSSSSNKPSFCQRVTIGAENDGDRFLRNETCPEAETAGSTPSWSLDVPVVTTRFESGSRVETAPALRFTVDSNFDRPFPQSHTITVCDPADLFFHWSFVCTPFTYSSLVKRMRWDFGATVGDGFLDAFQRFSFLLHDCLNNVSRHPSR